MTGASTGSDGSRHTRASVSSHRACSARTSIRRCIPRPGATSSKPERLAAQGSICTLIEPDRFVAAAAHSTRDLVQLEAVRHQLRQHAAVFRQQRRRVREIADACIARITIRSDQGQFAICKRQSGNTRRPFEYAQHRNRAAACGDFDRLGQRIGFAAYRFDYDVHRLRADRVDHFVDVREHTRRAECLGERALVRMTRGDEHFSSRRLRAPSALTTSPMVPAPSTATRSPSSMLRAPRRRARKPPSAQPAPRRCRSDPRANVCRQSAGTLEIFAHAAARGHAEQTMLRATIAMPRRTLKTMAARRDRLERDLGARCKCHAFTKPVDHAGDFMTGLQSRADRRSCRRKCADRCHRCLLRVTPMRTQPGAGSGIFRSTMFSVPGPEKTAAFIVASLCEKNAW